MNAIQVEDRRIAAGGPRPSLLTSIACIVAMIGSLAATALDAQQLRGTIRDSTTQRLVAGAIVVLLDDAGATRARSLTNQRGQYFFNLPADARRIRVQRIGFRAQTVRIPASRDDLTTIDITIASLPTLITPIAVVAGGCPRRNDRGAAAALLEQARVGLLATIIAREAKPSSQLRITYMRELNSQGNRILSQSVELDSAIAGSSFVSAKKAIEYIQTGFVDKSDGRWVYHGPDAEVLLDDDFVNSYCFHLADAEKARRIRSELRFNRRRVCARRSPSMACYGSTRSRDSFRISNFGIAASVARLTRSIRAALLSFANCRLAFR